MVVTDRDDGDFVYSRNYLGIAHSDDFIVIQITANDTRTTQQKQTFYARIAALLSENPGLRKEDVFINLVEVKKEDWSFGNGVAQYV
jgi:phenylpyruvate tautomerase PptA (4-oxalocrotonate tautomerase family)